MKALFRVAILVSVLSTSAPSADAELRTWTNASGQTIQAKLVSHEEGKVTLRLENGQQHTVGLDTLSAADGEYVKGIEERASAPQPGTEPLMALPGRLIYADDFTGLEAGWKTSPGEWKIVEGGLSGMELEADNHGAVFKRKMPVKDVIVEFDIRLQEGKGASFSMDGKGHLCRVNLSATSFQARKDDPDKQGPLEGKAFNAVPTELAKDEWTTVRIEVLGEEMLAQVGEGISLGTHPGLADEKTTWGFTLAGGPSLFRNLRLWEALPNPEWEDASKALKRDLGVE